VDCSSAIDGLSALFDACRPLDRPPGEMPVVSLEAGDASTVLNEYDSMAALDGSGIDTVPRLLVDSAASAVAFAEKAGWPVVLKGVVDSIAHKSDVGLVRLNIDSAATLRTQFDELADTIHRATKGANGNAAICVQKMVSGGFEVIAGITREAPLGYFLLVGIGGRFAEQIDDVHLWAIPASEGSIRDQLAATAVGRVLLGARWSRRQSFDELVAVLMNLQAMVLKGADRLKAVEINPLSLGNGKPVALDALVVQTPA
jgi:succinyl-CoA synthetase beta subunit